MLLRILGCKWRHMIQNDTCAVYLELTIRRAVIRRITSKWHTCKSDVPLSPSKSIWEAPEFEVVASAHESAGMGIDNSSRSGNKVLMGIYKTA